MRKRTLGRELALQILYQMELNPETVEDTLRLFWESQEGLSEESRTFAEKIVHGVLEYRDQIDKIIEKAADNWQLNRMAVVDRNILRSAVFELLYLQDIPHKVAINEAVNIAKKFSQEDSGKFVNGVLDKISHTEKTRYPAAAPAKNKTKDAE